jgi:hypothetical protein
VPEAVARPAAVAEHRPDERVVARLDSLLQLVGLRLCDSARGERRIDPLQQRLLERVAQFVRLDAELGGGVVDHRLALLLRVDEARRRDRGSAARDCECRRSGCYDLPFHGAPSG